MKKFKFVIQTHKTIIVEALSKEDARKQLLVDNADPDTYITEGKEITDAK